MALIRQQLSLEALAKSKVSSAKVKKGILIPVLLIWTPQACVYQKKLEQVGEPEVPHREWRDKGIKGHLGEYHEMNEKAHQGSHYQELKKRGVELQELIHSIQEGEKPNFRSIIRMNEHSTLS